MPDFNVRVTPYEREGSSIRGMASISFNGLAVNNVTIHEGKEGKMFVSMPSYKTSQIDDKGKPVYKDFCHPVTAKFRDKLDSVIDKLNEGKKAVAQKASENKTKVRDAKSREHDQPDRSDAR